MKIITIYDGTLYAKKAIQYGIDKIKLTGGDMVILQVFDPNQYADYGPRAEDLGRSEAAKQLEEAKLIVHASGIADHVLIAVAEGEARGYIADRVAADRPNLVLLPPRYQVLASKLSSPAMVIPGTIMVPVDRTGSTAENIEGIVREAAAMASRVLLIGVVPVHLYSKEEKKELERVTSETNAALRQLRKALGTRNIEVLELSRSGYPDEEILKAAAEFSVSLILLPSGTTTPSELSKAASILLEEPERLKWPVFLLPSAAV